MFDLVHFSRLFYHLWPGCLWRLHYNLEQKRKYIILQKSSSQHLSELLHQIPVSKLVFGTEFNTWLARARQTHTTTLLRAVNIYRSSSFSSLEMGRCHAVAFLWMSRIRWGKLVLWFLLVEVLKWSFRSFWSLVTPVISQLHTILNPEGIKSFQKCPMFSSSCVLYSFLVSGLQ